MRPYHDFDDDALKRCGFYNDIYQFLENVGWVFLISNGIRAHVSEEFALEMLMIMKITTMIMKITTRVLEGEEKYCLDFRVKDEER